MNTGLIKDVLETSKNNGVMEMGKKAWRQCFKAVRDKYRCVPFCFLVMNDLKAIIVFWLPIRCQ